MSITILAKTSLVVYLDKTLINILGNRAWIGRRLTDHLYDYDCVLLQSKLNKIAEKISAGFKKIHEIEPFYLRILKLNDSTQDTKKNKKSSSAITFKGKDMREFLIFKVDIKPDTVELKTVEDSEKTSSSSNVPGSCQNLNMETCFILKLSFPINSYLQEISSAERMFITEHNTNLKITRVENRVCELLGFLPQDLENRSLLKFIHPEDLEKIKNIHFEIYNNSQQEEFDDYRWRCFNGSFVSVRSKWSCLKHPWNKHIDLIIGKHFIVDEPSNKFIFDEPCKEDRNTIYRVDQDNNKIKVTFKENLKIVEKEIIELISRKIPSMEEETQILGQSMIKLINNKNISKHFYNEQMKKLRKHQKQKSWRIKQNETLKMFKRKNRMLSPEEPFYYTLNSKLNESRRERLTRLNSRSSHQVGKVVKKQTDKSLGSFGTKNKFSGKKDEKENSIECDAGNINNEENIKFEDAQFDASLFTDKGFFTHYTICKYIDDLPDEWSVENDELDELNATCNKIGVSVDSGSSGSANSSLNQKDSYKRTLSSQPINVPNKLNENSVTEQNMSNSDSSKTDSSQKKSKKFKPNDFTKNYIEFLLKKKDDKENITLKKSKNKTNTNEVDDLKKGLSTISSKSHSKIVLFNDQEYEEDAEEEDEEEFDEFENIQPPMKSSNLETSKNEDHDSAKNLSGQTETINNKSENLNNLNANLKSTSNDSGSNSNSNNDKKNTSSNEVLSTNSTLNSSLNKDSKFTQEALAKHTIEQDELYTQDILRKIRCPIKYYSGKIINLKICKIKL
jgi:PAS domain-containing protein